MKQVAIVIILYIFFASYISFMVQSSGNRTRDLVTENKALIQKFLKNQTVNRNLLKENQNIMMDILQVCYGQREVGE